ncbi:MAG: DNA-processing protein DprA [Burkholderiales bacterium]|nr:DNA-processing protein DprA [Burkholderiales bacterium]
MNKKINYYWLKLYFTYGVGVVNFLKLLQHFGSPENVFNQDINILAKVVGKPLANAILSSNNELEIEKTFAWLESSPLTRHIITLEDSRYPIELAQIANPPVLFFAEGDIELLKNNKIAIVGTRHPTNYGIDNANNFAEILARNNFTIVSGLAAGIDRYAHEGALSAKSNCRTIAVIGTGLDIMYPASNKMLYQKIRESGLIISEFSLGTPPTTSNFPRRNRIIVGLSKACLVVESAIDGGSMISANFALESGREVLAIPGSVHNPMARGCHKLIKMGAKLCETANDILDEIKYTYTEETRNIVNDEDIDPILLKMGYDEVSIDIICQGLNIDFAELCAKLLELELDGKIINCGNGRYQRVFNR